MSSLKHDASFSEKAFKADLTLRSNAGDARANVDMRVDNLSQLDDPNAVDFKTSTWNSPTCCPWPPRGSGPCPPHSSPKGPTASPSPTEAPQQGWPTQSLSPRAELREVWCRKTPTVSRGFLINKRRSFAPRSKGTAIRANLGFLLHRCHQGHRASSHHRTRKNSPRPKRTHCS